MARKHRKIVDNRPVKICTLDTETRGLYGKVFKVGFFDGSNYVSRETFTEIFPYIEELSKDYKVHIYVHNLDFDISKIAPEYFTEDNIDFSMSIFINGSVATLKSKCCTFHDSYKLLPSGLEALSDSFGLTTTHKMDIKDYIKIRGWDCYKEDGTYDDKESKGNFFMNVEPDDSILNEYLELDCRSLYDIMTQVIEMSELDIDEFIMCPTTPSMAMKIFKTRFPKQYKLATINKFIGEKGKYIEQFIRASYYGGRTEVFKPVLENGFHYDVNSEYPYVMKTFKFPIRDPRLLNSEDGKNAYLFWKKTHNGCGFMHVKIFIPDMNIPPLPYRNTDGKLIFPVGNIEGIYTFQEIEKAEKMGCEIKEYVECVFFSKTEYLFKEYVEYFEHIKRTSTGGKREFAKLCLNSLYGKFGMRRERTTFANMSDLEKIINKGMKYTIHYMNNSEMKVEFIEHTFYSNAEYIQPQIASSISSYSRLVLLNGLLVQDEIGDVAYCDTDSVACSEQMPNNMIDSSEFGKFKLESIIEKGIFLQPKFYAELHNVEEEKKHNIYDEKSNGKTVKAKGIPKQIRESYGFKDYEKFLQMFKEKPIEKMMMYYGQDRRQKFLTSMKRNDDFDIKVIMDKGINLYAVQKREIDYDNNTTKAWNIQNFGLGQCVSNKQLEKLNELTAVENDYDFNIIETLVSQYGKIKLDEKTRELYDSLDTKQRQKVFNRNGIDIDNFSTLSEWSVDDIRSELSVWQVS